MVSANTNRRSALKARALFYAHFSTILHRIVQRPVTSKIYGKPLRFLSSRTAWGRLPTMYFVLLKTSYRVFAIEHPKLFFENE